MIFQLAPADSTIVEQHQKEIQDAKKYAQKNVIVSFNSDKKEDKEDKDKDKIDVRNILHFKYLFEI